MTSLQKLRPPTAKIDCDECKKVHAESASCWQAYLAEKHLNRCRRFNKPSDRNPQKQNELLRLYQLATAHERVHRARAHPDKKHVVRLGDLKLILCKLRGTHTQFIEEARCIAVAAAAKETLYGTESERLAD